MVNTDNCKFLCTVHGGSHSYGLQTPTSDFDLRGIFINTDAEHLVGLKRDEVLVCQNAEKDEMYTEFRHALKLLKGANTQMVELLFQKEFLHLDPIWARVQQHRKYLVDSEKLFSCLRGYMQGELRLANGERTGKLGGKRKEAIDKYGFSPKNFVQLFRLAWAGTIYFDRGYFPVNVAEENSTFAEYLLQIKTEPQKFTKEELNAQAARWEANLVKEYENRKVTTTFSDNAATFLCKEVYGPLISKL